MSTVFQDARTEHGSWAGLHCEGAPVRSLFTLLLWDELFGCGVAHAFQTPYQQAPLDLDAAPGVFLASRRPFSAWLPTTHVYRVPGLVMREAAEAGRYRYSRGHSRKISWRSSSRSSRRWA